MTTDEEFLAARFEADRRRLRQVAYRMLGSLTEAEDAVQEAWLRLSRSDTSGVENLSGWLTTVVARVCLDTLRSRKARAEEPIDVRPPAPAPGDAAAADPEGEAILADSVGLAVLVVLGTLTPAERLAFVLHDMFGVSFDEIATMVDKTPEAARQLASRARRRIQGGAAAVPDGELTRQREVVGSFLAALRSGDFDALVSVLHPEVVIRIDPFARGPGGAPEVRGARNWAKQAIAWSRGAAGVHAMMIDGEIGAVLAPRGRLLRALRFTFESGVITEIEIVGDRARLASLDLAVVER